MHALLPEGLVLDFLVLMVAQFPSFTWVGVRTRLQMHILNCASKECSSRRMLFRRSTSSALPSYCIVLWGQSSGKLNESCDRRRSQVEAHRLVELKTRTRWHQELSCITLRRMEWVNPMRWCLDVLFKLSKP